MDENVDINSKDYFVAIYNFQTHSDPEAVFQALSREQTTTGFNTIKRKIEDLHLYQAEISGPLNYERIDDNIFRGSANIKFPIVNLSCNGNLIEDLLCFSIGESAHVAGFKSLKLVDLLLPDELTAQFSGPTYGVSGIRNKLNVYDRPFIMGPLRPEVGFLPAQYAKIAFEAFVGGVDIIKDDELLADPLYSPFSERIKLCTEAKKQAEEITGEKKMFIANIGADLSVLESRIEIAHKFDADGIMLHAKLTPSLFTYVRQLTQLPIVAHYESLPSISSYPNIGISLSLMLKLYRLSGADLIAFPRPNARFNISQTEYVNCLHICLDKSQHIKESLPMPTGGNTYESILECKEILNSNDYVYVSGSTLFESKLGIRASASNIRSKLNIL